jgi:hypothetical protein
MPWRWFRAQDTGQGEFATGASWGTAHAGQSPDASVPLFGVQYVPVRILRWRGHGASLRSRLPSLPFLCGRWNVRESRVHRPGACDVVHPFFTRVGRTVIRRTVELRTHCGLTRVAVPHGCSAVTRRDSCRRHLAPMETAGGTTANRTVRSVGVTQENGHQLRRLVFRLPCLYSREDEATMAKQTRRAKQWVPSLGWLPCATDTSLEQSARRAQTLLHSRTEGSLRCGNHR